MGPVKTMFRNLFGRGSRSGSAAIEFGLLVPILLAVVVGTVDLGFYWIQVMGLNRAVEAGALYALRHGWNPATGGAPIVSAMQSTGAVTGTPTAVCFYGCPISEGIQNMSDDCNSGPPAGNCPTTGMPAGQYVKLDASLSTPALLATTMFSLPSTSTQTATVRLQ